MPPRWGNGERTSTWWCHDETWVYCMRKGDALCCRMPPLQGCLALKGRNELASSQRHSMGAIAPVESPSVVIDVVISVCLAQRAQSTQRNSSLPTSLSTSDFTIPTSFSVMPWREVPWHLPGWGIHDGGAHTRCHKWHPDGHPPPVHSTGACITQTMAIRSALAPWGRRCAFVVLLAPRARWWWAHDVSPPNQSLPRLRPCWCSARCSGWSRSLRFRPSLRGGSSALLPCGIGRCRWSCRYAQACICQHAS